MRRRCEKFKGEKHKSMKVKKIVSLMLLAVMAASVAAGCTPAKNEESMSLTIGLMPAVDAAPVLLAQKNGYFTELGLTVTLQMYSNAQDRQSALQAQSIDGAITDLIAVAANVDAGFDIKATTMTNGVFPVLSSAGAESKTSVKVGMMEVSVTNFLIDEWLSDKYTIEKVYINDIPTRLAAIESGQLDMGLFPEPMASMGALSGLTKTLYQPEDGICPNVIVFTGKALSEKEEAVRLFHKAYNKAVAALTQNPEDARDVLMDNIPNLNPEVKDTMVLPTYTVVSLPDDIYIDKVIQWTADVMKKELTVTAGDLVERKFIEP